MNSKLHGLLAAVAIAFPMAGMAEPSLVGTWELTYVAPQSIENTIPRGVTNTKMYFTADGKLFALKPDATSLDNAESTDYAFDGKTIKLSVASGHPRMMSASFPDNETMVITQRFESQRTFKRISAFNKKLEPKSLQILADKSGDVTPTIYDPKDYSASPMVDRLLGIWEVIAYENVPRDQIPPYGFLNDLWTIKNDAVTILRRAPPATDSVPFSFVNGSLASSGIGLGGPIGSKVNWNASFNEWGHLILDSSYCRVVLKLVSKNTANTPSVPLKVVLLTSK